MRKGEIEGRARDERENNSTKGVGGEREREICLKRNIMTKKKIEVNETYGWGGRRKRA